MSHERQSRQVEYRRGLAHYRPIARLAVGGMGEVWRGEAVFPDGHVDQVAIKRVLPWLSHTPMYRLMLEDEARLGLLLKHENIVRVFDARMQGTFILVMEYVEGRCLHHVMARLARREMQMPLAASLYLVSQMARALTYAHEAIDEYGRELGVIHGDISPHNVLLSTRGDAKLMDFGLARATANLSGRDPSTVSGKSGYVAPELVSRREASQLNDLFSLGIVLWECLTGRRLFKGRTPVEDLRLVKRCEVPAPSQYNAAVTPELDELVERLLAKRPADRPQSARSFAGELEDMLPRLERGLGRGQIAHLVRRTLAEAREESLRPPACASGPIGDPEDVDTGVYDRPSMASSAQLY